MFCKRFILHVTTVLDSMLHFHNQFSTTSLNRRLQNSATCGFIGNRSTAIRIYLKCILKEGTNFFRNFSDQCITILRYHSVG